MPLKSIIPTDSIKTVNVAQKLDELSGMTLEEVTHTAAKSLVELGFKIIICLAVFFIGRLIIRYIKRFVRKIFEKREVDVSLRNFLISLVKISLNLVLMIIIISILGIDTTSFVALFASAGLAIGMALSGTLQNFAGGVLILVLRPYKVGDFIEAQGYTGKVKDIHLFNTVLNTIDNKTIIIPNGGLSTGIINNYSKEERRRVDWTFGIAYGDDYDKARLIVFEMLASDERVYRDPEIFIALSALANSSVNLTVRAWVDTDNYWDVHFALNEKVYKVFPQEGLNIPFPQMDVHIKNN